jgi:hypothetical protein
LTAGFFEEFEHPPGWHHRHDATPLSAVSTVFRRDGASSNCFNFAGFVLAMDESLGRVVALPIWALALALAALPAARLYRRLRRNHPAAHCRRCGYDLRATPGGCPECGTQPPRHGEEKTD